MILYVVPQYRYRVLRYTVSDPLASLAYGPRCSFGFGRGGPGL